MNHQGIALTDRQHRHLTPSAAWDYAQSVTGVPVIGISVPESEADSRWPRVCDYFFVRLHGSVLYGRGRAGSRKAHRPSDRHANPHGSVHLISVGCGFNRNQRIDVMDIHALGASAPVQAVSPAIFQFHSIEVRTIDRDGRVWFVAGDVAKALGYADAIHLTRVLDEDEAALHNVEIRSENGTLQIREVTILSESGLYHALLKSRKPQARPFRRWVTQEVLPAIRRSGNFQDMATQIPNLLQQGRFLLTFDHAGTPQLQFVPQDASIIRPQDDNSLVTFITEILDRKGLLVAYKAASERLMRIAQKELNS